MIPSRRILIFVVAVISALAAIGVSAWRLIDMQSSAPVAQAPVPPIANQALERRSCARKQRRLRVGRTSVMA